MTTYVQLCENLGISITEETKTFQEFLRTQKQLNAPKGIRPYCSIMFHFSTKQDIFYLLTDD